MNFGKHKGKHITAVPADYISWAREQGFLLPTDREIEALSPQ